VEPGAEIHHEFTVFLGPKDPTLLAPHKLDKLIEYGWPYAALPAKMLRGLLDFLHLIVPNYGLAIILLTVIVRCCMLLFSLKQATSAAKMQELAPEMQKIRDKYKDDMEKQGKAMQDLYAKHNFNPFGGCLLVFFQLPVFVGLYRCLAVDIELRDAPLIPGLLWASNLAGPDRLFDWKNMVWPIIGDEANDWFGPYFNVLPIITIVLFIIQQKLFTPPPTNDETAMQQKMMTYMTVFMGVMFYKVPAGLCVYIITSSLWGIAERKLLPKSTPTSNNAPPPPPPPKRVNPANGKKKQK
jgi:YidC/Oxa1 family membrane protein insertase